MPGQPLAHRFPITIGEVLTHRWFHPIHTQLYRLTGGWSILSRAIGMDMILVTVVGRRSSTPRTVPLAAVRDGRSWIIVGSNAGKARSPGWVHNLRSGGPITVEHRRARGAFVAREVTDAAEVERRWQQVIAGYAGYAAYRARTPRAIPLFVLEPA
ncbi:MAG: nitroreductase/quinone reductase family protein [Chloroflexota bacterium]